MADHRPDIYPDGDRLIFRASSLSMCDTRVVASALDMTAMPTPDFLQRAYDEGSAAEEAVVSRFAENDHLFGPGADQLDRTKWEMLNPLEPSSYRQSRDSEQLLPHVALDFLDDEQFTCEVPVGGTRIVKGHLDGIGQCYEAPPESGLLGSRVVVEAKFLGPDFFAKWLAQGWSAVPYYAMQVSIYGYATGLPVVFIVGEKLRHEGSDPTIERVHVTCVDPDSMPVHIGKVKARVNKLARYVDSGELPACTKQEYPCPYYYLHDDDEATSVEVTGSTTLTFTDDHAHKVAELALTSERLKATAKAVKAEQDQIKAELDEMLVEYRGDGPAVTVVSEQWEVAWTYTEVAAVTRESKAYTKSYPTIKPRTPAAKEAARMATVGVSVEAMKDGE